MRKKNIEFATYVNIAQGFQFDYPNDWRVRESTGSEETYFSVDVLSPVDADGIVGVSLSVTVFPAANQPGRRNLQDVVRDFLRRHQQLREFRIIARDRRQVAEAPAMRLVFSYLAGPFPHKDQDLVRRITEVVVFFQKTRRFFKLNLATNEDEFALNEWLFNKLTSTFKVLTS